VASFAKEIQALETTEKITAKLSLCSERDVIIDRLIAAIEEDRAGAACRHDRRSRPSPRAATHTKRRRKRLDTAVELLRLEMRLAANGRGWRTEPRGVSP